MLEPVVVTQLIDQLFHKPEVRGFNPVISNFIFCQLYWQNEINRKEVGKCTIKIKFLSWVKAFRRNEALWLDTADHVMNEF